MTIGDNGIFKKANSSRSKTIIKSGEEELRLSLIEYKTQNYDKNINLKGYKDWIDSEKNSLLYGNLIDITLDDENNPTIATVQYKSCEYQINSELNVNFNRELNGGEINKKISLDKENETIIAGNKVTLIVTVMPEESELEWITENEQVATVESGIVTGISEGTTNIIVKISNTNITASCEVTVKKSVAKIGDTYYESLVSAINNVPTDGNEATIDLLRDSSEGDITIANGQKITFNGANYTLTARITNNGDLKIINGTIIGWSYPLTNNGTMTITGGAIKTGSYNVIINYATLNISGGYFKQIYDADVVLWNRGGKANISGGKFETGNTYVMSAAGGNIQFSGSNTRLVSTKGGMPAEYAGGSISGPVIKNMTSSGCDVYAYTNDSSIWKLEFPTWTNYNWQDDIIWHNGTSIGNNVWYCRINASEHRNETSGYIIDIYKNAAEACIGGLNFDLR